MAGCAGMTQAGAGRPVVLVHSSDVHIDDGPGKGPGGGNTGLAAILRTAEALGADLVLLAGDTFDNGRLSAPVLERTGALLAGARVPVVMLPGNHDPLLPNCIFRRAGLDGLDHVGVLGLTHDEAIVFDHLDLEIRGKAHRSFDDMHPLLDAHPRRARRQVVMAHGHYVPDEEWRDQSHRSWLLSDAAIAATGADYIALGHWDRPTPVGDGSVPAYYSGSPDLAGTVNLVRIGETVSVERIALHWGNDDPGRPPYPETRR